MSQQILKIDINTIKESPYQGRLLFFGKTDKDNADMAIKQLADSISKNGLLQPIVVRGTKTGYELIDGHRRLEAHRLLGINTIDAIVKDINEKESQILSVVSNLQREDLYNIERALAFRKILDAKLFKDQKELSQAIGKDQTYVGDLLNTLNMDKRIIEDLLENKTTNDVRLLRAIRRVQKTDINSISEKQWELYQRFKTNNLTRKEVFHWSKNKQNKQKQGIEVKFKPRRIEVDLPKKYDLKQRQILIKIIHEKIHEILENY